MEAEEMYEKLMLNGYSSREAEKVVRILQDNAWFHKIKPSIGEIVYCRSTYDYHEIKVLEVHEDGTITVDEHNMPDDWGPKIRREHYWTTADQRLSV